MADDDDWFRSTRSAETVLASQDHSKLSDAEKGAIEAYANNLFGSINRTLRGQMDATPSVATAIENIRRGLRKYPVPEPARVSREISATAFGLPKYASVAEIEELFGERFLEEGFMSTSTLPDPPRSMRHSEPMILDLVIPAGTPALRLGALAEEQSEREVLVIDARAYVIVNARIDPKRSIWRLQAVMVEGGEEL